MAKRGSVLDSSETRQDGREWPEVCLTLFNEATGVILHPAKVTVQLGFQGATSGSIPVVKMHDKYVIPKSRIQTFVRTLAGSEDVERLGVDINLADACEIEMVRYVSSPVSFDLTCGSTCGCVPIPLLEVEETCSLRFRAYDCSFTDWVRNGEALLNNVVVVVTPVRMSTQPGQPATHVSTQAKRAMTVDGIAEITGLGQRQLYSIEMQAPQKYLSESPGPQYRYIGCETLVEVIARLRPCGHSPVRTAVFVHEECVGSRLANLQFEANGAPVRADEHGLWNIPSNIGDTLTLTSPKMIFQPPVITLTGAPVIFMVAVGEKTQKQLAAKVRVRHVDEAGEPFVGRCLRVQLPDGEMVSATVDREGYVHVPQGSCVWADEDAYGPVTMSVMAD
jgi:hypothetical protein